MFDRRLLAADVLKLRRRRGMLSISLLLTLGGIALAFTVMAVQHAGNPAEYGPAGGLENYRNAISFVGAMALVVGAIVGGTAGTQDPNRACSVTWPRPAGRAPRCSPHARPRPWLWCC